jgi:hypothetical protein
VRASVEPTSRSSALDGLDHFAGLLALLTTAIIGVELYRWLGLGRSADIGVLWIVPTAASFWRRAFVGEEAARRWPASWYGGLGAYFLIVLAIELIKKPATWSNWAAVVITVLFIGLFFRKAVRR